MARKEAVEPAPQPSALPSCELCGKEDAMTRRRVGGRWSNLGEACVMRLHQERADAFCARLGLDTLAKKLAWLRENRLVVRRVPAARREPGEE